MNLGLASRWIAWCIVHSAQWLVPGREREAWLAEWDAEVWHASHGIGKHSWREATKIIIFSLGAFGDACWIRSNHPRTFERRILRHGSASRCLLFLALGAVAALLACWSLPNSSSAMRRAFQHDHEGVVMLSRGGFSGAQSPTIGLDEYRFWKLNAHSLFQSFAFYQRIQDRIRIAHRQSMPLSIGRASSNLFSLLDSRATKSSSTSLHAPRLFLTQEAFRRDFGSDFHVIGSPAEVDGQQMIVAGIVDRNSLDLPGQIDAWVLEDEDQLAARAPASTVFVLARLRSSFPPNGWHSIVVTDENGGSQRFDCIPLADQDRFPFSIFLFTLAVALMALPATTPLLLGEYPRHSMRLPWRGRARRWVFLWSKILLLVTGVHFMAINAAYGYTHTAVTTQYIQLSLSFFGFLFGFRWILEDQRRRCPVCLRLLSNPARVGEASRNFLAWNGTELICAGGHGLLHIPEHPTSWFGTQRWLALDASWDTLFADGYIPHANPV